ncbi:MAG: AarF/ABC1/UbiB kinase family protein [Deltaproteobacteria bacterium]|nr:AarF/ABC1/UbiB kinase family protein [Deltaproteobacteria bacterium]
MARIPTGDEREILDDEQDSAEGSESENAEEHRPTTRFSRFARLSSMSAQVAARSFGQKVASAFQTKEEAEKARKQTLSTNATTIASTMGELKGAAMKIGQMLSADPDLLPSEMTDALSVLQKDAPPMSFQMVTKVVEESLGGPLSSFFAEFTDEPIGAASIGQVHKAITHEGQVVAVKVQYPGISDTIESDMKNFGSLLNMARVKLTKEQTEGYLEEITEVLKRESDYLNEADNLERFQIVLKDVEGVRVPTPVYELTRKDVLTMEFVEGERLTDWLGKAEKEERNLQGERVVHAYIHMMHLHGALHADPHPGNFLVDQDGKVVFLDLGCVRDYDLAFAEDLAKLLVSHWRGDLDLMMGLLDELGFSTKGVDAELIYEWFDIILEPLLNNQAFDFGVWDIHESARRFLFENPSLMSFHPPREALFYLRVLGGLRGIFGSADVRINAWKISKAAIKKMGLI